MMSGVEEPDVEQAKQPEEIFRRAVIRVIKNILERKKEKNSLIEYFILQNFGLDIAVFMKWSDNRSTVRFFELKAFVGSRQGGVGFGDSRGRGPQVDLLLLKNSQLDLANKFIRWLLVIGTKPKGKDRFVIFDNIQAKNATMGGVKRGKQNNFRISYLEKNAITWKKFLEKLEEFLVSRDEE